MGGMSRIVAEDEQGTLSNCPANNVAFNNGVLMSIPMKRLTHEGYICTFPSVREA